MGTIYEIQHKCLPGSSAETGVFTETQPNERQCNAAAPRKNALIEHVLCKGAFKQPRMRLKSPKKVISV